MALTLTLRQGAHIIVGGKDKLTLEKIVSDYQAILRLERDNSIWVVTDDQAVEPLKEVMISLGPPNTLPGHVKLVIAAPRHINIVRGEVLRRKRQHAAQRVQRD